MPFPYRPLLLITAGLLLSACNEQAPAEKPATPEAAQEPAPAVSEAPATPATAAADLSDPNVLVVVNGQTVSKDTYAIFSQQRRQAMPGAGDSPQEQLAVLNELINATLLRQDAEAQGLDKRPELEAMMDILYTRVLAEAALREYVGANEPSEDELKKRYETAYGGEKNQEFKARHILLKSEEEAKAVIAELDKGADFAELAKSKSTGPSGPQGGDLGWFEPGQMVEPFSNAVTALADGAYTSAPVQTQFGWHVILREEHRELEPPPFEMARTQLLQATQQELVGNYITQLREKGDIQIQPPQTPPQHAPMEQPAE